MGAMENPHRLHIPYFSANFAPAPNYKPTIIYMNRNDAAMLRLANQGLVNSRFRNPENVVDWMGMVQAQDYSQFRWAVGMRTEKPGIDAVREAFSSGKILRLHLMRCTIQAIAPQDLTWMGGLCREKNLRTIQSWPSCNNIEFSGQYYNEGTEAIKEILAGGKSLCKTEISDELTKRNFPADTPHTRLLLLRGEIEGLLCSGEMKGKDSTWALASERTKDFPQHTPASQSEALGLLARKYFRSHSPASFEDFCWWTGLTVAQNRKAVEQIAAELEEVQVEGQEMFIYIGSPDICGSTSQTATEKGLILLPPYDEYLIGYKSRWVSLDKRHEGKAHNNFGIFKPVILHDGRVVGNWKASIDRGARKVETEVFANKRSVGVRKLQKAIGALQDFCAAKQQ